MLLTQCCIESLNLHIKYKGQNYERATTKTDQKKINFKNVVLYALRIQLWLIIYRLLYKEKSEPLHTKKFKHKGIKTK